MAYDRSAYIIHTAELFGANREQILNNWMQSVKEEHLGNGETDFSFRQAFSSLVDSFITNLKIGDIEAYLRDNYTLATKLAYNDLDLGEFIEAFHLFEHSYSSILATSVERSEFLRYLTILDELHHKTIATVAKAYFDVKDATILALARLAELRDLGTSYHLERTREFSTLLAHQMNCSQAFINQLYRVGLLHDIGKVGIRDGILLKPGKLTPEEYEEIKQHTIIGADTINSIIGKNVVSQGHLVMARDIALSHHEKWNGSGYPYGRKGEQIPLAARIFALADAYDAMISVRIYKSALSHQEAYDRINQDSGIHFDPAIVEAFNVIHQEFVAINERYRDSAS